MDFMIRRVLAVTPFYMLFEFFLFKYIFLLIGGIDDAYILLLTVFVGLIHFTPMIFEKRKSRKITRFLTTVDGLWMWASVMFLIDIVVIYLIGQFIKLPVEVNLILLLIVPILGVYNYFKAHRLVVNEKTLKFDNLTNDVNIAHLSDVHFGSIRHKQIIDDIAFKLNSLDCDVAIISGDLTDGSSVVLEDDFLALKDVKMPVIFTPGNHDFYREIDNVIKACRKANIVVLDNDSFEIENLNICGLSFSFEDKNILKFDESLIKEDKINIINYHVPYHWEEFSDLGFDIQLSGHTHGGQFYPAIWFGNLIFRHNKGLFKNSLGKYLHVTTGVGSMGTPMRWGTDSEIVVLKLRK